MTYTFTLREDSLNGLRITNFDITQPNLPAPNNHDSYGLHQPDMDTNQYFRAQMPLELASDSRTIRDLVQAFCPQFDSDPRFFRLLSDYLICDQAVADKHPFRAYLKKQLDKDSVEHEIFMLSIEEVKDMMHTDKRFESFRALDQFVLFQQEKLAHFALNPDATEFFGRPRLKKSKPSQNNRPAPLPSGTRAGKAGRQH